MKEYIIGLVAVTLICGLITSLTGGGGSSEGLRAVCGICVLAVIVLPAVLLFKNGTFDTDRLTELFLVDTESAEYYDEIYNSNFADVEIKNAEEKLKNEIIQELLIDGEGFDIELTVGNKSGEKFIECVEIIIYSNGLTIDPHSVENYIKSRLDCACNIVYCL